MKRLEREALRLGLSIVSTKMAEAMGVPGLNVMAPTTPTMPQAAPAAQPPMGMPPAVAPRMSPGMGPIDMTDAASENDAELPTTVEQTRDRSAKIAPGRVITTQ